MLRATTALILVMCLQAVARAENDPVQEGRSVGKACSSSALVCATLKDGSVRATDECGARREPVVRVTPGDCFDAD